MQADGSSTLINGLTGKPVAEDESVERFILKIPTPAFAMAAGASKAALITLGGIYFIAGLARRTTDLRLAPSQMDEVGATAKIQSKGLSDLEEIGLIVVSDRRQGRGPTVSLVDGR